MTGLSVLPSLFPHRQSSVRTICPRPACTDYGDRFAQTKTERGPSTTLAFFLSSRDLKEEKRQADSLRLAGVGKEAAAGETEEGEEEEEEGRRELVEEEEEGRGAEGERGAAGGEEMHLETTRRGEKEEEEASLSGKNGTTRKEQAQNKR